MIRYLDDFEPGQKFGSGQLSVEATRIKSFGAEFDPQPFHLDEDGARETFFKGLAASGWHTAAVSMRLFVDTMHVAGGIIGLGVDELKWPNAVRPGDELRLEIEILQARHSKSRPGYGIIRIRNVTKNQRDEVVQSFMANTMLPTREADL